MTKKTCHVKTFSKVIVDGVSFGFLDFPCDMRSPDRVEGSMIDLRDQRVAMTSHVLDHLEGSCAWPRDQRVTLTMRSPERVEGSKTGPRDRRVAMTSL